MVQTDPCRPSPSPSGTDSRSALAGDPKKKKFAAVQPRCHWPSAHADSYPSGTESLSGSKAVAALTPRPSGTVLSYTAKSTSVLDGAEPNNIQGQLRLPLPTHATRPAQHYSPQVARSPVRAAPHTLLDHPARCDARFGPPAHRCLHPAPISRAVRCTPCAVCTGLAAVLGGTNGDYS